MEQRGQRTYPSAVFTHLGKLLFTKAAPTYSPTSYVGECLLLHSLTFPKLCQSIRWAWYLSLVLIYTVPGVNKVEHLFNRIQFPSRIKWCFIKPQATTHDLAGFFIVRRASAWESQACCLPLPRGLVHGFCDAPERRSWAHGRQCRGLHPSKKRNVSRFLHLKHDYHPTLSSYPAHRKCLINVSYWQTWAPVKKELSNNWKYWTTEWAGFRLGVPHRDKYSSSGCTW